MIRFRGNGWTSDERASDLALMRAAELALRHRYRWFAIAAERQGAEHSTVGFTQSHYWWNGGGVSGYSLPILWNVRYPRSEIRVFMFNENQPREAFDAKFVYESVRTKYWEEGSAQVFEDAPLPAAPHASTESRLAELDRLLVEGQITNAEYAAKRKEILAEH